MEGTNYQKNPAEKIDNSNSLITTNEIECDQKHKEN